jgi:hypothetical protein
MTRKPWSWALHNAAAMAVPYSLSGGDDVGVDNRLLYLCRVSAPVTCSIRTTLTDDTALRVVRQPIDDLVSAATS